MTVNLFDYISSALEELADAFKYTAEEPMPVRVDILERVVQDVAVPVKRLGVRRVGHYRVCRDKPAERRVVAPGTIIVQSRLVVKFLRCEFVFYGDCAGV